MDPFRISAVSYLNTFPFVYGLKESGLLPGHLLHLKVPSKCADDLKEGRVDVALVPAGALPGISGYHLAADYCIGATGRVRTVLMLSKVPLRQVRAVHLDLDSRTSVQLVRVLAREQWKITPGWVELPGELHDADLPETVVAIGDKTFALRKHYRYVYDLAEEWYLFTGLPMVFAVWASRRPLPAEVRDPLNRALAWGIARKKESVEYFRDRLPCPDGECIDYLENCISYELDDRKKEGLDLFQRYLEETY